MLKNILFLTLFISSTTLAMAQQSQNALPPSNVDFDEFVKLTKKVQAYRAKRMVDLETFIKMANEPDVIVLDTRSKAAYTQKHIAGAVHLNFSDFTAGKLKKLLPSKDAKILIYCNNNFSDDVINFPEKAVGLALNIPTFINLYGYGYKNLYELSSLVKVKNPALKFEGTDVK